MSVTNYLVTYGQAAFLGRFPAPLPLGRGERVVLRTVRGLELGTILGEAATGPGPSADGEVVRAATAEDAAAAASLAGRARGIVVNAQALADSLGLPLLFLDGEVLLDGSQAILQAVHWADCDATPLFDQLSARHGLTVKLADLTAAPQQKETVCATCGDEKSGCSSCGTGGGCSSGSCAKGSVKSADELTAYFAGLRRQMEAVTTRVSLH